MTPAELDSLRSRYDVIPLVRRMSADSVTPVAAYAALDHPEVESFLLESVERGEAVGRYSFIGIAPRKRQEFARGERPEIEALKTELRPLRVWQVDQLPPFFGGAVGWFGYGIAGWSEAVPDARADEYGLPDAELLFFDHVLAFDHVRQELIVVANVFSDDERASKELLRLGEERLATTVAALHSATINLLTIPDGGAGAEFEANMSPAQFTAMVGEAKEQIAAGEVFQIVVSQRWSTGYPSSGALTLYRVLRSRNPSPYMFLLKTRSCTLVGTSPEMLVRLSTEGSAETRPIAGTRPRSSDPMEDQRFADELSRDPKEMAEHLMLVDLGRNDVGRVAASGSVRVTRFAEIERYSHVMHLVSDVKAHLVEGSSAIELFLSAFPAGTVSGAPKIRAMELIDELEPTRRGPYAGAVAYFGFGGSLDSCIAIRTILLKDGKAWVQAGAGIVYDSVAEREFEETMNKSAAMRRAIELAAAVVSTGDPA